MPSNGVHSVRFNQDASCFAVAMDQGCRLYNVSPFRQKLRLDHSTVGSLHLVEMLHRTNLLAMVGGGLKPRFADNTVLLYDARRQAFVYELTFDLPVLGIRMRRDRMIVALHNRLHVFAFPEPIRLLETLESGENPHGVLALSSASERCLLAMPAAGKRPGQVQLADLSGKNRSLPINAHFSALVLLTFNHDASMLASASKKGTLIRVWSTRTQQLLVELRRGLESARLYSAAFSPDSEMLAVVAASGTCHVFAVRQQELNRRIAALPRSLIGSLIGGSTSLATAQWGFGQFQIPADSTACVGFASPHEIVALSFDGRFYKYALTSRPSAKRSGQGVGVGGVKSEPAAPQWSAQCHCAEFDVFVTYEDDDWLRNATSSSSSQSSTPQLAVSNASKPSIVEEFSS